ncbi:hypothetical protein BJX61DRAFT_96038 [Aspergillus egyptiacus]|nr:hypothetical protein BJX61DRAFT_96038 [Aspergillus egyptiacus]
MFGRCSCSHRPIIQPSLSTTEPDKKAIRQGKELNVRACSSIQKKGLSKSKCTSSRASRISLLAFSRAFLHCLFVIGLAAGFGDLAYVSFLPVMFEPSLSGRQQECWV